MKYAILIALGALTVLNLIAVVFASSTDAIVGLIAIAIGWALLKYQFSRGRDLPGRLGCISWLLPLFGAWYIIQGAYTGLIILLR